MQERLGAVEQLLLASVDSDDPLLAGASRHLVEAGGKRFRPLLVLLASYFGDPAAPGIVPAAVVVELTHLATLYHDDVMDEAQIRRGEPPAGAPPHVVDTITSACEKIGVAFQLSDDILDITSESEQSGKTPGTDLREGIRTLPMHHVLSGLHAGYAGDARLRELLVADLSDDDL